MDENDKTQPSGEAVACPYCDGNPPTPLAPLGGLTEALEAVADSALKACDHWDANCERGDPAWLNMVGKLRLLRRDLTELAESRLTAPRAEGVDALQDVLAGLPRYGMTTEWYERQEAVKPEGSAFLYSETETRHHSRRVIGRVPNGEYVSLAELTAALTAAAPKVANDWLDEMVDRRAPEVRAKMEQRVNELRAEAAAPQAEAGDETDHELWWRKDGAWNRRELSPTEIAALAQPAAQGGDDARDAARYRRLRALGKDFDNLPILDARGTIIPEALDAAIDALAPQRSDNGDTK